MRNTGSKTKAKCWKCQITTNGIEVLNDDYATLQEIAEELGYTYNQVVEISNKRKKSMNGKYDTQYHIERIKYKKVKEPDGSIP
tara:strand:+ start:1054 stop:1305 length:252 start_codon:yes stop_codon:yes gene_type:complete